MDPQTRCLMRVGAEGFDSADPAKGGGHGTFVLAAVVGAGGRSEVGLGHAVGDEELGVTAGEGGDL